MKIKKQNLLLLASLVWMIAGFNVLRIGIETYAEYQTVINYIVTIIVFLLFWFMVFYKLTDFARLEPGYFGIPEPASGEIVDWPKALMIMPGVAFDRANHRVGYGGGFYDRYLEKHPQLERVAIAFSFQMLPEVPTEPTDICPQIIVTEEEICYLTD